MISESGNEPILYKNDVKLEINNGTLMKTISWVELYQKLNIFIADDNFLALGEDKQIGPFFLEFDTAAEDKKEHKNLVMNKLLHYLWSDVHKASYRNDISLFDKSIGTFSKLYSLFGSDSKIFSDDFLKTL